MEQIAQLKDFQKIISDETVTTSKDITQPYSELEIIINQKSKNPTDYHIPEWVKYYLATIHNSPSKFNRGLFDNLYNAGTAINFEFLRAFYQDPNNYLVFGEPEENEALFYVLSPQGEQAFIDNYLENSDGRDIDDEILMDTPEWIQSEIKDTYHLLPIHAEYVSFILLNLENGNILLYDPSYIHATIIAPDIFTHLEDLIDGIQNDKYPDYPGFPLSWYQRKLLDTGDYYFNEEFRVVKKKQKNFASKDIPWLLVSFLALPLEEQLLCFKQPFEHYHSQVDFDKQIMALSIKFDYYLHKLINQFEKNQNAKQAAMSLCRVNDRWFDYDRRRFFHEGFVEEQPSRNNYWGDMRASAINLIEVSKNSPYPNVVEAVIELMNIR